MRRIIQQLSRQRHCPKVPSAAVVSNGVPGHGCCGAMSITTKVSISSDSRKLSSPTASSSDAPSTEVSTAPENAPVVRNKRDIGLLFNKLERVKNKHKTDPRDTTVLLFPGQGSQFVGMVSKVYTTTPNIPKLFEVARKILGYDLLDICINGPIEKLSRTEYCQPAVFVASLAAVEHLRATNQHEVDCCVATAGFSLGELTSLVFSGAISFEDGLRLVHLRGQAMQVASEAVPSGLATVFLSADSNLNRAMEAAREWCKRSGVPEQEAVCSISNYLFPHCKVIGGHQEALKFLETSGKDFGIKGMRRLPVSGAFHTALMTQEAQDVLRQALDQIEVEVPRISCYSNYDALPHRNPEKIKQNLVLQMSKPVKWEQILHKLYDRTNMSFPTTYECGPGSALLSTLKMVNREARAKSKYVSI